jgi:hypothetical protein
MLNLFHRRILVSIFTTLFLASGLMGCEGAEPVKTKAPDNVKGMVGKNQFLSRLRVGNKNKNYSADEMVMTLSLVRDDQFTGVLVCNDFALKVKWQDKNRLTIVEQSIDDNGCPTRAPVDFPLPLDWKYTVSNGTFILTPDNSNWSMTFQEL